MQIKDLKFKFLCVLFMMTAAICFAASAQSNPKEQKKIIITDKKGVATKLVEYGIVYRPFARNELHNAIREYVIIERGDDRNDIEKIPWDTIQRIEITDKETFTITLNDGNKIKHGVLRGGNVVGKTEEGNKIVIHLTIETRTIEVLQKG